MEIFCFFKNEITNTAAATGSAWSPKKLLPNFNLTLASFNASENTVEYNLLTLSFFSQLIGTVIMHLAIVTSL